MKRKVLRWDSEVHQEIRGENQERGDIQKEKKPRRPEKGKQVVGEKEYNNNKFHKGSGEGWGKGRREGD